MIFPEGTCTNRSCLITFKPGRYDARFSVLYRMFLYLRFLKYHLHCNLLAVAEVELKIAVAWNWNRNFLMLQKDCSSTVEQNGLDNSDVFFFLACEMHVSWRSNVSYWVFVCGCLSFSFFYFFLAPSISCLGSVMQHLDTLSFIVYQCVSISGCCSLCCCVVRG